MQNTAIHWSSSSKHVDLDTGEQITKYNAEQNYLKIQTKKYATINTNKTKGHIEYVIGYRRNPQGKLSLD